MNTDIVPDGIYGEIMPRTKLLAMVDRFTREETQAAAAVDAARSGSASALSGTERGEGRQNFGAT